MPAPTPTDASSPRVDRDPGLTEVDVDVRGVATTALGAADVRDTPRLPDADAVPDHDPWVGRVLSNVYRVEAKIGEGGMGAVYSARHVHIGKQVAVKVLAASVAANGTAVERLKQEAISASSIEHDNIVEIVSFDRYADGAVFIVMELLRGESLAERLGRGPMTAHETLVVAKQLCSALGAAHERGIVHRDLKPENVFLARKGDGERAKVLDFGISKVKSADAERVRMTRTGQLVGTPLYMSPEQARGEVEVDLRADVYALGVMLYEMLTGSPPFEGRNYFELLWKHGSEPPQPMRGRNANAWIPDELDAVVLRALAKTPEERFATMRELSDALSAAIGELPADAPSARASTPRVATTPAVSGASTRWLVLGGVVVVALAGLAGVIRDRDASDAVTPPAGAPAAIEAAPVEEPAMMVAPIPAANDTTVPPSHANVTFESEPAGAIVRLGDRVLGTTPFVASLAPGEAASLVFHRDGFVDETEELVVADGAILRVRLRRAARRARQPGSTLPIKTEL